MPHDYEQKFKDLLEVHKLMENENKALKAKNEPQKEAGNSDLDLKTFFTEKFKELETKIQSTQSNTEYQTELAKLTEKGITNDEFNGFIEKNDFLKDLPNTADKVKLAHKFMIVEHLPEMMQSFAPKVPVDPVIEVQQATPISSVSQKQTAPKSAEITTAESTANRMLSELGVKTK